MMDIRGSDGVLRTPDEHYDTQRDVEQDPYGAHLAIHLQAAEIVDFRAQLAAAEANCDAELTAALMASEERHKADKLAAMERVMEAAIKEAEDRTPNRPLASRATANSIAEAIRALKLDALAEGDG